MPSPKALTMAASVVAGWIPAAGSIIHQEAGPVYPSYNTDKAHPATPILENRIVSPEPDFDSS